MKMNNTQDGKERYPFHIIEGNSRWWLAYNISSGRTIKIPPHKGKILKLHEEGCDPATIAHQLSLSADECTETITAFSEFIGGQSPASPVNNSDVSTLTIVTASDCNLRCSYCQESSAQSGSYGITRMSMPRDIAMKSIDFLFEKFRNIHDIEFFGGEPLLNLPLIREICDYVTNELGKDVWYGVNTNGTIMNPEVLDAARDHNIHFLVSFDGPKSVHDACRSTLSGEGSYEKVMKTMKILQEEHIPLMVLCTLNAHHFEVPFVEILDSLTEYTPYYQIRSVKNVSSPSIAIETLPSAHLAQMGVKYADTLVEALCEEHFRYYDSLLNTVMGIIYSQYSSPWEYCCDALMRVWLFSNGSLYPCGMLCHDNFYMGSITEEVPFARVDEIRERLRQQLENSLIPFRYRGRAPMCLSSMIYPTFDPVLPPRVTNSFEAFYGSLIDRALLRIMEIREDAPLWQMCKKHLVEVSEAWKKWASVP